MRWLTFLLLAGALQLEAQQSLPARYGEAAARIIQAATRDSAAWRKLARLTDTFGPRFSGTEPLERAIDWVLAEMKREGLENVRGEEVMVPRWVRGTESVEVV
ncbi:MAG TPA: peptidase M28 family protein, partial [Gemmatimonadales bacterium]|nr:peptidase M28 family protein [Gemmatimonadales bacterium]